MMHLLIIAFFLSIFLAITEDTSISKELKYRWFALIAASIVYTYLIAFIY